MMKHCFRISLIQLEMKISQFIYQNQGKLPEKKKKTQWKKSGSLEKEEAEEEKSKRSSKSEGKCKNRNGRLKEVEITMKNSLLSRYFVRSLSATYFFCAECCQSTFSLGFFFQQQMDGKVNLCNL